MAFAYAVFAQFLSLEVAALLEKKRIVYEFFPDFGKEASGLFTDFYRSLWRRLPD